MGLGEFGVSTCSADDKLSGPGRNQKFEPRQSRVSLFVVLALAMGSMAFKPKTHLFSGNQVVAATNLTIAGKTYAFDARAKTAIDTYPRYYRAGVVGPDAFPDIIFGQGQVHPDTRCANGLQTCAQGTYTFEWLSYLFDRGIHEANRLAANGDPDSANQVIAFIYGYLTHAAGDLWAHTLVNNHALGVFPGATEMVTEAKRNIALRHLAVEGYIGNFTPTTSRELSAPISFVRSSFIRDLDPDFGDLCANQPSLPTNLAKGSHFERFLDLRRDLCGRLPGLALDLDLDSALGCLFAACAPDGIKVIQKLYVEAWIQDIDRGLDEWPYMSEDIARALFVHEDADAAADRVQTFFNLYLLSMVGAPDVVGHGLELSSQVKAAMESLRSIVPGYAWFQEIENSFIDWMVAQGTGLTLTEWKEYVTHPENKVSDPAIGLSPATPQKLKASMGVTGGSSTFSPGSFAAFDNATTLAKLIVVAPATLDELAHDLHVGALFTGARARQLIDAGAPSVFSIGSLGTDAQRNAMLGYVHSIDGNDAWRMESRNFSGSNPTSVQLSQGMLFWRDCLARKRVFPALFKDGAEASEFRVAGETSERCDLLAEDLNPIELLRDVPDGTTINGCGAKIDLTNHLDVAQPFSLYVRIVSGPADISCPGAVATEGRPLSHTVEHGTLPPKSTSWFPIPAACGEGAYKAEIFVFRNMAALPAESEANQEVPTVTPYFGKPVQMKWVWLNISTAGCSIPSLPCTPGSAASGGGVCPPEPTDACALTRAGASPASTGVSVMCSSSLDADRDGRTDHPANDNCPVTPNPTQEDSDNDGTGDLCEVFTPPDFAIAKVWPDPRFEEAIRSLMERNLLWTKWGGPHCLSCPMPPFVKAMARVELEKFAGASKDVPAALARLASLVAGPRLSTFGAEVLELRMPSPVKIQMTVNSGAGGIIGIELPAEILRPLSNHRRFHVKIDGRTRRDLVVSLRNRGTQLVINVPAKARQIQITGRRAQ